MFQQINRCGLITKALFYPIRRITELHVGQKCCRTLTDIKLSFGKARQFLGMIDIQLRHDMGDVHPLTHTLITTY